MFSEKDILHWDFFTFCYCRKVWITLLYVTMILLWLNNTFEKSYFNISTEPFELARHSSTSSNECIEHGAGNRATFESELEEYEEPIIEPSKEKLENETKSETKEITSGLSEENDNDRKRYSSTMQNEGRCKSSIGKFLKFMLYTLNFNRTGIQHSLWIYSYQVIPYHWFAPLAAIAFLHLATLLYLPCVLVGLVQDFVVLVAVLDYYFQQKDN